MPVPPARIAAVVAEACRLEAAAPKPGNVSPGRPFGDMRFEDFVASAEAIAPVLGAAAERPLGATVLAAVQATRQVTRANTNLGMVLLLAPLARAAAVAGPGESLRAALRRVLEGTTVADSRDVYKAIRLASPGGLGTVPEQDVADEPTEPLVEAMRLAASRDDVAREYATAFAITFDLGWPTLQRLRAGGLGWDDAVVQTFLTILTAHPDTHIARRAGRARAMDVSARAAEVLRAGGVATPQGRAALDALDARLRDPQNLANPGTAADLTAAAVFTLLASEQIAPALTDN